MKARFVLSILGLVALMFVAGTVSASPQQAPAPRPFTFQGHLTDGGLGADGVYDFEFSLYDADSGGSQVGSTVPQGDVTVTGGLFTVQLDFGDVFDGTPRYLEVGVRPGASEGAYTTLVPREALTATPYALYAAKAPWEGLTGMPAGFADGVDDNTTYTAGDGLDLAGSQFSGKGTPFQNVIIVAKSGGDYDTIQAALDSITDAAETNPYLVWIAPGVYTELVTMKPYVVIEGAGEEATKITFTGGTGMDYPTLRGANHAALRSLTVESTGGAVNATAMKNGVAASTSLNHVAINASGGTSSNVGVYNQGSSPEMTALSIGVMGGLEAYGVLNAYGSSPQLTDVNINVEGANDSFGMKNWSDASPTLDNVQIVSRGGVHTYGVYNFVSSPTIRDSDIDAQAAGNDYGIYNEPGFEGGTVVVTNSKIIGGAHCISNIAGFTTRVANTQCIGGSMLAGGGTLTCAGIYDVNFTFYPSTCP